MNADERGYFDALTARVLGAVFEVSNTLGAGFLGKVYQRALLHELHLRGMRAAAEVSFPVTYKDQSVGEYFADILVEDVLVIELRLFFDGVEIDALAGLLLSLCARESREQERQLHGHNYRTAAFANP